LSSSAYRAWSSSGIKRQLTAKPSTFLPFLYQTPTIQQRRGIRTPRDGPKSPDSLTFFSDENSVQNSLSSSDEQLAFHQQRPTTITDTERKAFQKLFSNLGDSSTAASNAGNADVSLNSIFEGILTDQQRARGGRESTRTHSKKLDMATIAESMTGSYVNKTVDLSREDLNRLIELQRLQEDQSHRITAMMSAAKTDAELWNILDKEVFTLIRNLNLDGKSPKKKARKKSKAKKTDESQESSSIPSSKEEDLSSSIAVIGPNFPSFLVTAVRQLRQEFPNSSLPLNIIPTVKTLGRGPYVLGASTMLYNELIAMAWIKYADLQYVEELIQDMDNGGVDFDVNTLEMLDSMKAEGQELRAGSYGEVVAAAWSLDRFVGGWAKLERWKDTIKDRLQADAIRKANSSEVAFR